VRTVRVKFTAPLEAKLEAVVTVLSVIVMGPAETLCAAVNSLRVTFNGPLTFIGPLVSTVPATFTVAPPLIPGMTRV